MKAPEQQKQLQPQYRLCKKCGYYMHINQEAEFCIVCGDKLLVNCSSCGAEIIYPIGKHCHKCGTDYKK